MLLETHPRCFIASQRPAGTPSETAHADPTAPPQPQELGGGGERQDVRPAHAHGMSNLTTRSSHIVYANRSAHVTAIRGATRSLNHAKSAPWQHEGAALPSRCWVATRKCAGTFTIWDLCSRKQKTNCPKTFPMSVIRHHETQNRVSENKHSQRISTSD